MERRMQRLVCDVWTSREGIYINDEKATWYPTVRPPSLIDYTR